MTTHQLTSPDAAKSAAVSASRRRRIAVMAILVFAATVALFYLEENIRGHRVWNECKRELLAQGAALDWSPFLAPAIPAESNAFATPIMAEFFVGRGRTPLSDKLDYKGYDSGPRRTVAVLTIGLPGDAAPLGAKAIPWSDTPESHAAFRDSIHAALGPSFEDAMGAILMLNDPEDLKPAQVFFPCAKPPTPMELWHFVRAALGRDFRNSFDVQHFRFQATGSNTYTLDAGNFINAGDYVAWCAAKEPVFGPIRAAVARPFAQILITNDDVLGIIPNFVTLRVTSQRLSSLARCNLLLGRPQEALDALTFLHRMRRVVEFHPSGQTMTLVAAMIDVAVAGLYESTVEDGFRSGLWNDQQLAELQQQLSEIRLRPYVANAFSFERASIVGRAERGDSLAKARLILMNGDRNSAYEATLAHLLPDGWADQNLAVFARMEGLIIDAVPANRDDVEPRKLGAAMRAVDAVASTPSPFNLLAAIAIPNFSRAVHTLMINQTKVNQAQIACALERFRLAHGQYPATLEELTPRYMAAIPRDLVGGQLPHYHLTDKGSFLLYSIGWTEQDHGGHPENEGDIIWMRP